MMLVIGVTGGIASGKSTLAKMIAGRGIAHVDADKLVHGLLQHDREMIAAIAAAFPDVVIPNSGRHPGLDPGSRAQTPTPMMWPEIPGQARDDGQWVVDRSALARHITKHPEALATLEHILHPRVRALEREAIAIATRNGLRALVLDIPLLFETDADALCDVVIVAYAPLAHRRRRAFARAGMTEEKWQRLLARQLPDHHRNALADIVIRTDMGKAATKKKITALMKTLGL